MTSATAAEASRLRWSTRETLELAAGVVTLVAAGLYGYGWLVLAQFYGSFDINPEDVGVTFAFITVRVALVVAVLALAAALVTLPLLVLSRLSVDASRLPRIDSLEMVRFLRALRHRLVNGPEAATSPLITKSTIRNYAFRMWAVAGGLAVLVAVLLSLLGAVNWQTQLDPTIVEPADVAGGWIGLGVLLGPIWLGLLVLGLDWLIGRLPRAPLPLRWLARLAATVLAIGGGMVFVAGIWLLPRQMADTVRGADLAATVPYIWVIGLRADSVHVTTTDGAPVSPRFPGGCTRLLGSAGGVTVLFDPARQLLVRVPNERLIAERPCP